MEISYWRFPLKTELQESNQLEFWKISWLWWRLKCDWSRLMCQPGWDVRPRLWCRFILFPQSLYIRFILKTNKILLSFFLSSIVSCRVLSEDLARVSGWCKSTVRSFSRGQEDDVIKPTWCAQRRKNIRHASDIFTIFGRNNYGKYNFCMSFIRVKLHEAIWDLKDDHHPIPISRNARTHPSCHLLCNWLLKCQSSLLSGGRGSNGGVTTDFVGSVLNAFT